MTISNKQARKIREAHLLIDKIESELRFIINSIKAKNSGALKMTHKHNGGPAFPLPVADQECSGRFESDYGGMSLRDYFAAKAMQGLMSIYWEVEDEYSTADELIKCHVETAYEYADAMLTQREKMP